MMHISIRKQCNMKIAGLAGGNWNWGVPSVSEMEQKQTQLTECLCDAKTTARSRRGSCALRKKCCKAKRKEVKENWDVCSAWKLCASVGGGGSCTAKGCWRYRAGYELRLWTLGLGTGTETRQKYCTSPLELEGQES